MNLKEAFRFQNRLQKLTDEASFVLTMPSNITTEERTYLRKKVMPEAENEVVLTQATTEYAERITDLASLLMFLLEEREKLSKAIRMTKAGLSIDMDSEVSLNAKRQSLCEIFRGMDAIRSEETVITNGGTGYRFNAEGNQVTYKCDLKQVTTIHFDRNTVRRYIKQLNQQIDKVSAQIDLCLVDSKVDYTAPFDVNDPLSTVFEAYLAPKQ